MVFEFSARKVGPNVYTFPKAIAPNSPSSWPLTVKLVDFPKKSKSKFTSPKSSLGRFSSGKVVTLKSSPAPSASLEVIIGVCKLKNPFSLKNSCTANDAVCLILITAEKVFVRMRKCAFSRKNSRECRLGCIGYKSEEQSPKISSSFTSISIDCPWPLLSTILPVSDIQLPVVILFRNSSSKSAYSTTH